MTETIKEIRRILLKEEVREDELKQFERSQKEAILQFISGITIEFDPIKINNNYIKWGGVFDNDVIWRVDTSSDNKIFISMDSKAMNQKKIASLSKLVTYLENQFINEINKLN